MRRRTSPPARPEPGGRAAGESRGVPAPGDPHWERLGGGRLVRRSEGGHGCCYAGVGRLLPAPGAVQPPDQGQRATLTLRLGCAEALLVLPEAVPNLREALSVAREPADRAVAALGIGRVLWAQGRSAEAADSSAKLLPSSTTTRAPCRRSSWELMRSASVSDRPLTIWIRCAGPTLTRTPSRQTLRGVVSRSPTGRSRER